MYFNLILSNKSFKIISQMRAILMTVIHCFFFSFLLSLQIILKHLKFVKKFETFDFGLKYLNWHGD